MPVRRRIRRLKHFAYLWYEFKMQSVHATMVWSLNHDLTTSLRLNHPPIFLKSILTLHKCNSAWVDPYAHPQHSIKVLQHFACIWYEFKMRSMQYTGAWSLNHNLTTSLGLNHTPISKKIHPRPAQVYQCKDGPISPSTAYQGAKALCILMNTYDMNLGCNQCNPQGVSASSMTLQHHLGSTIPQFSKIHPHLYKRYSVWVDPCTHPQHSIEVLKHFACIWYGSGMQSTGVWSLNPDLTSSLGLNHTPILKSILTCTSVTV